MSEFAGSRVLIIGGAGFVGSNLTKRLLQEGCQQVTVVDNLLSADISQLPEHKNLVFINESINSERVLASLEDNMDYVFHLATYHGNQSSIEDPLKDHENNTLTSLKLFDRIAQFKNIKKVVYAGAGCTVAKKTFENSEATSEQEEVSLYLDSPYQMSKIFGEFYGNYYYMRYGMPFVKARFQNVYGPGEVLGAGQWRGNANTVWRNVTPTFCFKALHNLALPLDKGGVATRDFIFVDDIVEGLCACALKGQAGGVYNLASGVETSIRELAEIINEVTGNKSGLDILPARDWDRSGKRHGNTDKAEKELNFKAKTSLPEGIKLTANWMKNNLGLIKSCMSKHKRYVEELNNLL